MKHYQIPLLIAAAFLYFSAAAQNSWTRITPIPQENTINHLIRIPGTDRMMAAASGSTVMYSDDAGGSWQLILNPAGMNNDFSCNRIHFINDSTGFIAGNNTTILKTTNQGIDWEMVHSGSDNVSLSDVYFPTQETGFAAGESGMLLRTDDGGDTWQQIPSGTQTYLGRIAFTDGLHGFITFVSTTEWLVTTDGGVNWEFETLPPTLLQRYIYDIVFVNDSTGFLFQDNGSSSNFRGYIFKTSDGGQSWIQVYEDVSAYTCDFAAHDEQHIAALSGTWGYASKAIYSNDGGENWNSSILPDGSWFASTLCYYNAEKIFAAGYKGYLFASTNAGVSWEQTDVRQFRGSVRDVQFLDSQQGYALYAAWGGGVSQTLLKHTGNGGLTWESIFSPHFVYGALSFLSPDSGYIIGSDMNSIVLKTTNGGQNWEEILAGGLGSGEARIRFYDMDHGIITGLNKVLRTNNGGMNWETVTPAGWWIEIYSIAYRSADLVYMCGTANFSSAHVFISNDGGSSWEIIEAGAIGPARHMCFVGEQTIFLACFNAIRKSTDGGYTWQETNLHTSQVTDFHHIYFPSAQTGYATGIGPFETIFKTTDGGDNWYPLDIPATSGLNFVFFTDDLNGIVFGNNGLVMSTETGGVSSVTMPTNPSHKWFSVRPNPFEDELIFMFDMELPGKGCILRLYDMYGRVVHSAVLNAGSSQYRWVPTGLPSGIYISRLLFPDGRFQSEKLIKR